jgi:sugar phosphate isomerase/epimerase
MGKRSIDRRAFLSGLAGSTFAVGAAALAGPAAVAEASDRGRPLIPQSKLGIQMWSIRDKLIEFGFGPVFEELSRIGYRTLEFAGYPTDFGEDLTAAQVRQLLDDNGLDAISSHRPIDNFRNSLEEHLDIAETLGLRYLGTPEAPPGNFGDDSERTVDSYKAAADDFNRWGAISAARGITIFQHNHTVEFSFAIDRPGVRLYDVFLRRTNPRLVSLQMDILWAFGGARKYPGFRPIDYVKANPRRFPMFHVKDGVPLPDPQEANSYQDVEFGLGVIPYAEFLSELSGRGRYEYLWEQDSGPQVLPNPPGSLGAAERSRRRILDLQRCGTGRS